MGLEAVAKNAYDAETFLRQALDAVSDGRPYSVFYRRELTKALDATAMVVAEVLDQLEWEARRGNQ